MTIDLTRYRGPNDGHHSTLADIVILPMPGKGDYGSTTSNPSHPTLAASSACPEDIGDPVCGPEAQSLSPGQPSQIDLTSPGGPNDGHHGALAENAILPVPGKGDYDSPPPNPPPPTLEPSSACPEGMGDIAWASEAQSLSPAQRSPFQRDGTLSDNTKSAIIRHEVAKGISAGYIGTTNPTTPSPPAAVARSNSPDESTDQVSTSEDTSFVAGDAPLSDIPEGSSGHSDDSAASEAMSATSGGPAPTPPIGSMIPSMRDSSASTIGNMSYDSLSEFATPMAATPMKTRRA